MASNEGMTRPSASARGYDAAWRRVRKRHLMANPLCVYCLRQGIVTAANVVDHIERIALAPHRRLDPANLQSLCKRHHDADKQAEDKGRALVTIGLDGWPVA